MGRCTRRSTFDRDSLPEDCFRQSSQFIHDGVEYKYAALSGIWHHQLGMDHSASANSRGVVLRI